MFCLKINKVLLSTTGLDAVNMCGNCPEVSLKNTHLLHILLKKLERSLKLWSLA